MTQDRFAGLDVSKWQNPEAFDWVALGEHHQRLTEETGTGLLFIARATYGAHTEDKRFVRFHELCKRHGLIFGAYHFYRQVHSVESQLAAWQRQMDRIGGLVVGDLLPTLDMEHNGVNGDGDPVKQTWNRACDEIGDGWKDAHGGAILYYSSYFPDWLGAHQGHQGWKWMHEPGYYYWLADYSSPPGAPRSPYQPKDDAGKRVWHLHQPKPRPISMYSKGQADIDRDFANPSGTCSLDELRIKPTMRTVDSGCPEVQPETDDWDRALDQLREGCAVIAAAAGKLLRSV